MTTAETYVTAAYCVVFGIVLMYVLIIALKLQRLERDVDALEAAGAVPGEAAAAPPETRDAVGAAKENAHG